jgi:hypothetical protein
MTASVTQNHITATHSRLNAQEIALKKRLEELPEFALAGYQVLENRTFRGVLVRRSGSVRGLWTFTDGHYRWIPVGCNSEPYATGHEDRALRHMMLLVLKGLLVRRAVRKMLHGDAQANDAERSVA